MTDFMYVQTRYGLIRIPNPNIQPFWFKTTTGWNVYVPLQHTK